MKLAQCFLVMHDNAKKETGKKKTEKNTDRLAEKKPRKKDREQITINAEDILYIERGRGKSTLHCYKDGKYREYIAKKKLEEWYEELKYASFAYAHNSYIVNVNHVVTLGNTELELDNGEKLPVARSKLKEFKEAFVRNL